MDSATPAAPRFSDLQNEFRLPKGSTQTITNTRIGDGNAIYGGSFHVPEDRYVEWMQAYYRDVVLKGGLEYLTEKQIDGGQILIDADFRHDYSVTERVLTAEHVEAFVRLVADTVASVFRFGPDEQVPIFVYQKPRVNRLADKHITKDGLHIVIGTAAGFFMQDIVREDMLAAIARGALADITALITNPWTDVLDNGIAAGSTNWQLVGSRKPDHDAYELVAVYNLCLDTAGQVVLEPDDVGEYLTEANIHKLSARYIPPLELYITNERVNEYQEAAGAKKRAAEEADSASVSSTSTSTPVKKNLQNDYAFVEKCIEEGLFNERAVPYNEWFKMGCAIHAHFGADNGWPLFDLFSNTAPLTIGESPVTRSHANYDKFEKMDGVRQGKKPLGFGSIKYWAREANKHVCARIEKDVYATVDVSRQEQQAALVAEHIPPNLGTETAAVLFVQSIVPEKFMWVDKVLHCWTGLRWEKSEHEFVRYLGKSAYDEVMLRCDAVLKDARIAPEYAQKAVAAAKDHAISWQGYTKFTKIIKTSASYMARDDVEFDANTDLLGFTNGVYDLAAHEFRAYRYDDFMTMTCGYDYVPECDVDPARFAEMDALLKTIMPLDENRALLLQLLSAGLVGRAIENFVMLNGGGRNGKGLIIEFLKLVLGEYALIYANVSLLTEDEKTGANPEKAAIDKKRMVVMKEPRADVPINNACVKAITGGGNIAGRMLYSNKTTIDLHLLLIMECNHRPKFAEEPKDGEYERMIDLEFPHRFSTIEEEIDHVTVFPADVKYKTAEWKGAHRDAFLHILLRAFRGLQASGYKPVVPQNVRDRTNAYLNLSFPILELFNDAYTHTSVPSDVVKMKDVYDELKRTDAFMNFTKKEKRLYTYKYVCEFFEKHRDMRAFYRDRVKVHGVYYKNALTHHTLTATAPTHDENEVELEVDYVET
jgi:phage/plasmid-associated DNA primase